MILSKTSFFTIFLLYFFGNLLNCLIYTSIEPLIVFFIFQILFLSFICVIRNELEIFHLVFSISYFFSGISAFFLFFLKDNSQIYDDAGNFFRLTSDLANGYSLEEIAIATEGSGAVILWRFFYNIFAYFSFAKERYIGLLLNSFFVSLSGVLFIRIIKIIYNNNKNIIQNGVVIFSSCSIFWLYSSVHLRDGIIFFIFNQLIYFWVIYIYKKNLFSLAVLVFVSVVSVFLFGIFRTEFFFVPIALVFAFLVSLLFSNNSNSFLKYIFIFFVAVVFIVSFYFLENNPLFDYLLNGNQSYKNISADESNNSLGNKLIVSQPFLLRIIFGSIYLFIFPIPIWFGFFTPSIISFFKSLNSIYLLFTFPILLLIITNKKYYLRKISPQFFYFLVFTLFGFIFSIAYTSLEIRHFGTFYFPFLILISSFQKDVIFEKRLYQKFLFGHIGFIVSIHFFWVLIKYVF